MPCTPRHPVPPPPAPRTRHERDDEDTEHRLGKGDGEGHVLETHPPRLARPAPYAALGLGGRERHEDAAPLAADVARVDADDGRPEDVVEENVVLAQHDLAQMAARLPLPWQRATQDAKPVEDGHRPLGLGRSPGLHLVKEVPLLGEREQVKGLGAKEGGRDVARAEGALACR